MFHLKASLEGHAGQVLWELRDGAREDDVIDLLRNRFGTTHQVERFRQELRTRRRKPNESIQAVYQDVRRLLALGYPGQVGEMYEVIGRDFFLDALDDQALRIRVLDQQPRTLDEALSIVCRMEAYSKPSSGTSNVDDEEPVRRKVRGVKSKPEVPVVAPVVAVVPSEESRRLQKLEETLANQQHEIRQLRSEAAEWRGRAEGAAAAAAQVAACMPQAPPHVSPLYHTMVPQMTSFPVSSGVNWSSLPPPAAVSNVPTPDDTQPKRRYQGIGRSQCKLCYQRGHWARECPMRNQSTSSGVVDGQHQQSNVGKISDVKSWHCETYMDIQVDNGKKAQVLIDTGCERSCLPLSVVPNAKLGKTHLELKAANGTSINVLGTVNLSFKAAGVVLCEDFLVSEDIDEIILGFHWLKRNKCQWLFDKGIIVIDGVNIPLKQRPSNSRVRRIYVRESVVIPPDVQVNVPVRMPLVSWRTPV